MICWMRLRSPVFHGHRWDRSNGVSGLANTCVSDTCFAMPARSTCVGKACLRWGGIVNQYSRGSRRRYKRFSRLQNRRRLGRQTDPRLEDRRVGLCTGVGAVFIIRRSKTRLGESKTRLGESKTRLGRVSAWHGPAFFRRKGVREVGRWRGQRITALLAALALYGGVLYATFATS